jgi:hypothetical protein
MGKFSEFVIRKQVEVEGLIVFDASKRKAKKQKLEGYRYGD